MNYHKRPVVSKVAILTARGRRRKAILKSVYPQMCVLKFPTGMFVCHTLSNFLKIVSGCSWPNPCAFRHHKYNSSFAVHLRIPEVVTGFWLKGNRLLIRHPPTPSIPSMVRSSVPLRPLNPSLFRA